MAGKAYAGNEIGAQVVRLREVGDSAQDLALALAHTCTQRVIGQRIEHLRDMAKRIADELRKIEEMMEAACAK